MADVLQYKRWQKEHPNFITPHILSVKQRDDFFVELSEGTGMEHQPIFGVSILHSKGNGEFETLSRYEEGVSTSFPDKVEAQQHQQKLLSSIAACKNDLNEKYTNMKGETDTLKEFAACLKREIG